MKPEIQVNNGAVHEAGLDKVTDFVDWGVLDYLNWIKPHGEPNFKINYRALTANMPLLGLNTKPAVSRRIKKLNTLGLLNVEHDADGAVWASFTDLSTRILSS